ncbi:NAD(P)-binding domain-containing protein [Gordonia sp. LSe1-13]|uniref:NAD(P)-binding domain-containing protein n=1 Tax=Gordonia sesuvii TaxID=3116777 RepID=A0ABU7MC77_9ACTN|nr:NAD(P)-binding domain-containing protein [Gordonia sp. LSe1-13]
MKIAVIGTGMVGRVLAGRLAGLGHDVVIGTRDVQETLARTETDALGTVPYAQWQAEHDDVQLMVFEEAGRFAELVVNASNGSNSIAALRAVGAENLRRKVLVDVALPLDMSQGMPPTLSVANTDSLGEQIQREFPEARVVKTLNTVFCQVMVDPDRVPGDHTLFIAGNDEDAKNTAGQILTEFGWPADRVIDLGDITGARGTEMYMRLYFQLAGLFNTFELNIQLQIAENAAQH